LGYLGQGDKIGEPCDMHGETRNLYVSLVRSSERRFPFGRRKWENSIKTGFEQNRKESSGFI
jgi:hypothetical protein